MAEKFAGFTGPQSLGKREAGLQASGRVGELLLWVCHGWGCSAWEPGAQDCAWKATLSGGPQEMRLGEVMREQRERGCQHAQEAWRAPCLSWEGSAGSVRLLETAPAGWGEAPWISSPHAINCVPLQSLPPASSLQHPLLRKVNIVLL